MSSGGDDSDVQFTTVNRDPASLAEFAKTKEGQPFADQINSLADYSFAQGSDGTFHGKTKSNGYMVDQNMSGMDQAYTAWLATQKDFNQQRQSYLDLADQEKGRDSTILTGPAAAPQGTLLTPMQAKARF